MHFVTGYLLLSQLLGAIHSNKFAMDAWIRLNSVPDGSFASKNSIQKSHVKISRIGQKYEILLEFGHFSSKMSRLVCEGY